MKKISFVMLLAAAVSLFAACNKEMQNGQNDSQEGLSTFVGYIDDATKTTLDGVKVCWVNGDEIKVNNKIFVATVDEQNPTRAIFKLKAGQSAPTGTSFRAAYPTGAFNATSGRFSLPASQTYKADNIAGVSPMYAVATSADGTFHFKNVCGLLAIDLKGEGTVSSIVVSADQALTGTLTNVAISDQGVLSYTVSGSAKSVTLTCSTPVQLNTTTPIRFYVAVPEVEYTNLKVLVNTSVGNQSFKAAAASVKKNNIYHMSFDIVPSTLSFSAKLDVVKNQAKSPTESMLHVSVTPEDKEVYYMVDVLPSSVLSKYKTPIELARYDRSLWSFTTFQQFKVQGLLHKGDVAEVNLEDIDPSIAPGEEYVVFAYAMDEDVNLSPAEYSIVTTATPSIDVKYEDYLGKWIANGDLIEVTQKVEGKSYNVTGFSGMVNEEGAYSIDYLEAEFSNGYFVLMEQKTNATGVYGSYSGPMYVSGMFYYSQLQKYLLAYMVNSPTPSPLITGELKGDVITIYPGSFGGYEFEGMGFLLYVEAQQAGLNMYGLQIADKWERVKEAPSALLGQWTCASAKDEVSAKTYTNWVWNITKTEAGVGIENFDVALTETSSQYGGTLQPAAATYSGDEKSGVLTVKNGASTGLTKGSVKISWYGDYYTDYDVVFDVDLEKGTITMRGDYFDSETISDWESQTFYNGPIKFTKGAPAPTAKINASSKSSDAKQTIIKRTEGRKNIQNELMGNSKKVQQKNLSIEVNTKSVSAKRSAE